MEPGTKLTDTTNQADAVRAAVGDSFKPGDVVTTNTQDASSTIDDAAHKKRDDKIPDAGSEVDGLEQKFKDFLGVADAGGTTDGVTTKVKSEVSSATKKRRHVPSELDLEDTLGGATGDAPSLPEGGESPAEGAVQR
jgi:hypothetical protein